MLKNPKKENISVDGDDSELLDVLSNYSTRRVPCTGTQLKKLLLEIAHKEIIQAPSYIRESWESIFLYTKFAENLSDFADLCEFLRPTNKFVKRKPQNISGINQSGLFTEVYTYASTWRY